MKAGTKVQLQGGPTGRVVGAYLDHITVQVPGEMWARVVDRSILKVVDKPKPSGRRARSRRTPTGHNRVYRSY